MDLISRRFDDGSINLGDPKTFVAETSQKYNLHLDESTKADDREDFMKATEKEKNDLTTEDVW